MGQPVVVGHMLRRFGGDASRFSRKREYSFRLPREREVVLMIKWEELFLFCNLLIALITCIIEIVRNEKK